MAEKSVIEVDDDKVKELYQEIAIVERPTTSQCYCNQSRDFKSPDFLCSNCSKWFHKSCIQFTIGRVIPFMTAYYFMCKNCNELGEEVFSRKQSNFSGMCQTAIANLMCTNNNRAYYSKINDIIPFLEQHWESLTTQPKKQFAALNSSIHKTLLNSDLFKCYGYGEDLIVSLKNPNLHIMKPGYDQFKILASQLKTKVTSSGVQPQSGGWHSNNRKRKAAAATNVVNNSMAGAAVNAGGITSSRFNDISNGKPSRRGMDEPKVKLTQYNFPVDHPYNKDNYRYIYVEYDPHAPGRQSWEECESTAGRIIPGFFYRTYNDPHLVLSTNDKAHQLKLSDNQLIVTGNKGYCMIRGTQSVSRSCWYFEAEILEQPEGSHARIGWSQSPANLQAPCGYDKFSYSVRSRLGTAFHDSCGYTYMKKVGGYGKGDVLGCLFQVDEPIQLADRLRHMAEQLTPAYKNHHLVRFKGSHYYEIKEDPVKSAKELKILKNSRLIFYKNGENQGVAFKDIYDGMYFPSISLYKSCVVKANFGPHFKYPPMDITKWKPMSERFEELVVEQVVSDMVWLTSNKELMEKMLKSSK